jgi:hypothetical protein
MHGIILRIAVVVGAVMVQLSVLAVTEAMGGVEDGELGMMAKFSSSRSSHIQAMSIQTLAVLSVVLKSISTSLRMVAECFLTISARRGPNIHAPTIPSFDIISYPSKVAHGF